MNGNDQATGDKENLVEPEQPDVIQQNETIAAESSSETSQENEKGTEETNKRPQMVPDIEEGSTVIKPKPTHLKNYASKDSGAVIMTHSVGCKGADNLLVSSRDKYIICPCEEKQFVVISLSEDILVRTIKIGSFEKYSRIIKEFQVLGSHSFPVDNWMNFGTFTASNVYGEQIFELSRPSFARYLKFKLVSHYGDDYYCTMSHIRVHGSTMMENFHQDLQDSEEEIEELNERIRGPTIKEPEAAKNRTISGHENHTEKEAMPTKQQKENATESAHDEQETNLESEIKAELITLENKIDALEDESTFKDSTEDKKLKAYAAVVEENANTGNQNLSVDANENILNNESSVKKAVFVSNKEEKEVEMKDIAREEASLDSEEKEESLEELEEKVKSESTAKTEPQNETQESSLDSENLTKETKIEEPKSEDGSSPSFCSDLPSFAEFKDKKLAKSPSKENNLSISGQYENIFQTMLNKIKALEISQSIFSLYVDKLHACIETVGQVSNIQQKQEKESALLLEYEELRKSIEILKNESKSSFFIPNAIVDTTSHFVKQLRLNELSKEKIFEFSDAYGSLVSMVLVVVLFAWNCVRKKSCCCCRCCYCKNQHIQSKTKNKSKGKKCDTND